MTRLLWIFLAGGVVLTGCSTPSMRADTLAEAGDLQREQVQTDPFLLTSFSRITRTDQPLTVYIEGDGMAWRSRSQPSTDPTPHRALGLALAAADPSANVAYVARPCQFTPMAANPRCNRVYWTGMRFSEEVVTSMEQAVTHYHSRVPGQPLHLVGYSGGGALAVLIAARRTDVASLRTVAGNLDHVKVNRLHKVSAMPDSLNPIDFARQVAGIPQIHFSGADDTVVPTVVAQHFEAATASECARIQVLAGMGHESDWAEFWPMLLTQRPGCSNKP